MSDTKNNDERRKRISAMRLAMREKIANCPGWPKVHQHEVNGKTVSCNKGTNCRKAR